MYRIAIVQFPGSNCELETQRVVARAHMEGVIWRWNQNTEKLRAFDGYIIPGGFSYEDRIRAGVVAAHDSVMTVVGIEASRGKPVLGICNGAQILVEAGLVPGSAHVLSESEGVNSSPHAMLGMSKKVTSDGELLGTGYYNEWVWIRSDHEDSRTAFTLGIEEGFYFRLPIAHGEGRFIVDQNQLDELIKNGQAVFRYCDSQGFVADTYPVNPNGALYSLAGLSNVQGNVLALMPHPERTEVGLKLFDSMKHYIDRVQDQSRSVSLFSGHDDTPEHTTCSLFGDPEGTREDTSLSVQEELSGHLIDPLVSGGTLEEDPGVYMTQYIPHIHSVEIFVELIITDNTADTLRGMLAQRELSNVFVRRFVHYEIQFEIALTSNWLELESVIVALIKSDELLNINKENPFVRYKDVWYAYGDGVLKQQTRDTIGVQIPHESILVRDIEDFVGLEKLRTLSRRLHFDVIHAISRGIVWGFAGPDAVRAREYVLKNSIISNPTGQTLYSIS